MYAKILDFSNNPYNYEGEGELPIHTCEAIENYLLYGMRPGGFVEALLANDVHRAVFNGDQVNKHCIWQITYWLVTNAPAQARGSYEQIDNWCSDKDMHRSKWADHILKQATWNAISR